MYADGYHKQLNIDYSAEVIKQMAELHPEMQWLVMDATEANDLDDESFDCIVDKSLIDAILTDGAGTAGNQRRQPALQMTDAINNQLMQG